MNEAWKVIEHRSVDKDLIYLPKKIQILYRDLIDDLQKEGPYPMGWNIAHLQGQNGIRIKLTREYRVIIEIHPPNIIVVKIAHRKEVYE